MSKEGWREISSVRMYYMFKNLSPRKIIIDIARYLKEDLITVAQKKRQKRISKGLLSNGEEFGLYLKFNGKSLNNIKKETCIIRTEFNKFY